MAEKKATRQAYGKALVEIGRTNEDLIVMDADLSKSTMTAEFGKTYPDRFFNMGIAEQNLYGAAAGLALSGKIVCASTFAMFATGRAFEIIRNSIGYTRANVKICATHAGITVGEDGASHQTFEDIALMRTIPGMTVINPSDGVSAKKLLEQAVAKAAFFMEKGGVFIFDLNTPYKHRQVLADNEFVLEGPDAVCRWRNACSPQGDRVDISIQIDYLDTGEVFREQFSEYTYEADYVKLVLEQSGFALADLRDGETFGPLRPESQRYIFTAVKQYTQLEKTDNG